MKEIRDICGELDKQADQTSIFGGVEEVGQEETQQETRVDKQRWTESRRTLVMRARTLI